MGLGRLLSNLIDVVGLGEQEETLKLQDQLEYWMEQADYERGRGERERHEIYVFRESLEGVRIKSRLLLPCPMTRVCLWKGRAITSDHDLHCELVL